MIDTIVLRIHGVKRYRNIIKSLDNLNAKGFKTSIARVDKRELERLRNQGHKDMGEILDIMKMQKTGEFLVKAKYAKAPNHSGHYNFAYMVNYSKDYIELNFSVPKYVYGSNVLLFCDHQGDRNYSFHQCWPLEHNISVAYDRMRRFLRELFNFQFINIEVDARHVEVHRIDVCFNQVFRTKEDALKYLEYQKRKRKRHSRDEDGQTKDYDTSIMYVTKRYSAKIYHKGAEYRKRDAKEHQKYNEKVGRQYFRIDQFQGFADRILRYELTLRTGMINYLHKQHIFRRNCPHYRGMYSEYQKVDAAKQKNDRIAKRIGELPEDQKEQYRKEHPYEKIPQESRKVHKYVSNLITKRTHFTIEVDQQVDLYNRHTMPVECEQAHFSKDLFNLCLLKLVEFMKEYEIKELPEDKRIELLVDEYNQRHKKKLPKSEMLNFYRELTRFGSFRETAKFYHLSRTSLYRYKERFRKIGISDNNLIPLTPDGIPKADLDFREYHNALLYDYPRILGRKDFLDLV